MAVPTYAAAGTLTEGTGDVTVAPNSGHASGDYELLVIESQDQAAALSTAAGFTEHPGSPVSAPSGTATLATRLTLYERLWNGTDGSPTIIDPTNHAIAVILSFRHTGVGSWATLADVRSAVQGTGWQSSHEEVDDGSGEWPGITTDTADQLIIGVTAHAKPDIAGGTAEMSNIVNSNLTAIAERFDDAAASGNGGWIGAFTGEEATSGQAIGVTTYDKATVSYKAHLVIAIRNAPPAAGASIDAQPGSFAVTGAVAGVPAARVVSATPGSYALTGQVAGVPAGRVVSASPGSYALSGDVAALLAARILSATAGVFTFTGAAAGLVLGGGAAAYEIDAAPGSFTLTGSLAGALAGRAIAASPATFVITGVLITNLTTRVMSADPGTFSLTGLTAGLVHTVPGGVTSHNRTVLGVGT